MNDKNVESFALGAIVVLLVYFLLEKKFRHAATPNGSRSGGESGGGGGCGCGGSSTPGANVVAGTNAAPIPLGAQPLNSSGIQYTASPTGYVAR
jgi:hypothetical protein